MAGAFAPAMAQVSGLGNDLLGADYWALTISGSSATFASTSSNILCNAMVWLHTARVAKKWHSQSQAPALKVTS